MNCVKMLPFQPFSATDLRFLPGNAGDVIVCVQRGLIHHSKDEGLMKTDGRKRFFTETRGLHLPSGSEVTKCKYLVSVLKLILSIYVLLEYFYFKVKIFKLCYLHMKQNKSCRRVKI